MGFSQGSYAKVWDIKNTEWGIRARITTSYKNRQTDQYEQDFGGWVKFLGKAKDAAAKISEGSVIRILGCSVTNKYDKEAQKEYVNYNIFDFEQDTYSGSMPRSSKEAAAKSKRRPSALEEGDSGVEGSDDELPF